MNTLISDAVAGGEDQRLAAEHIIARYPEIDGEELRSVLRYLKKTASAIDRATIGANPALAGQYRQLRHDHYFDRLRPLEIALVALVGTALLAMIVATIWLVDAR